MPINPDPTILKPWEHMRTAILSAGYQFRLLTNLPRDLLEILDTCDAPSFGTNALLSNS